MPQVGLQSDKSWRACDRSDRRLEGLAAEFSRLPQLLLSSGPHQYVPFAQDVKLLPTFKGLGGF